MNWGAEEISAALLDPQDAVRLSARGKVDAAVLIPLYPTPEGLVMVFTERRADLRRHPGEISFPGGRREPGEDLWHTALREAHEEVGLEPDQVRVLGALPPIGTLVTGYRVYPFVGLVPADVEWIPEDREVARILPLRIADLVEGHRRERLWRKGVPVRTATYTVQGHLIWGATARILNQLLARLPS